MHIDTPHIGVVNTTIWPLALSCDTKMGSICQAGNYHLNLLLQPTSLVICFPFGVDHERATLWLIMVVYPTSPVLFTKVHADRIVFQDLQILVLWQNFFNWWVILQIHLKSYLETMVPCQFVPWISSKFPWKKLFRNHSRFGKAYLNPVYIFQHKYLYTDPTLLPDKYSKPESSWLYKYLKW